MPKKKKNKWTAGKILLEIVKLPYYLVKGIIFVTKKTNKKAKQVKVKKERKSKLATYEQFTALQKNKGDYIAWEKKLQQSDSTIGIILGARGTGKTAFGMKLLENIYAKKKTQCYAMGFDAKEMPSWITVVENIDQIKNNAHVLLDEGGIFFSSRKSMSNVNKMLSDLILVARHKNLSIAFISQNSSNLDVNILRQADYLVMKRSSLLQKDFERKIIKELYEKNMADFEKYDDKGLAYIHADTFQGFISNPLPSFWTVKISKSFK